MDIEQIRQAISRTGEARQRVRQHRNTDAIIDALAQAAKNWLEPNNPWRLRAIEQAPAATGFSSAMVSEAVDLTFSAITDQSLHQFVNGELGDRKVLDGSVEPERGALLRATVQSPLRGAMLRAPDPSTKIKAIGPQLIAHFLAGNVPAPGIVSICCGLLLKSANLVKVSGRDSLFPTLFVESLRMVDAELADCVAVLDWRREERALTQAALAEADAVIAYGDDETVEMLRRMCRPDARFIGYGHKLSFAVVGREALKQEAVASLAESAAFDVSVYDQQGCLSPHVVYVEKGGAVAPRDFAAALAGAMAAYQLRVPRGQLSIEESAQIAKLRGAYEFRSASDKSVAVWASAGTNGWLVIYEEDPMFTPSCLNRVVFVKPVERLERITELLCRFAPNLSTVGIAPLNERAMSFANALADLGVNRVCPIGQMQRPPLTWHHDGRPNLADLVRWVEVG